MSDTRRDGTPRRTRKSHRRTHGPVQGRRRVGISEHVVRAGRRVRTGVLTLTIFTVAAFPVLAIHDSSHTPESTLSPAAPGVLDPLEALGVDPAPPADGGGFLHPDAAFVLSAEARDAHTIVLRWTLAATYFLHRDGFDFTLSPSTLELDKPRLPRGTPKRNTALGEMEVYYRKVEIVLPVKRLNRNATQARLEVRYRGCTDRGLCYPPMTKSVTLALPSVQ